MNADDNSASQRARNRTKRGNVMSVSRNLLPLDVIKLLLQLMALPNSDEVRASASRILGKCNLHNKLIPLFITWMKNCGDDSIIPSKTAADLEFPSLEMVSMLSLGFPVEKLLDWTNTKEKMKRLEKQCLDMLDCLIKGGSNIGQMLSRENLVETGGILQKILRCLKASSFETLQCRSIDALLACRLNQWDDVIKSLLELFVSDEKINVKSRACDVLFHPGNSRGVIMDSMFALCSWLRHKDVAMRLAAIGKCNELNLINKENIIILRNALMASLEDPHESVREAILEAMVLGSICGQYLHEELIAFYEKVIELFKRDAAVKVKVAAAKCLLVGSSTDSPCCVEVTDILGAWVSNLNRQDLYLPAIMSSMYVPSEYWTYVDVANTSSRFRSFNVAKKLSVQSLLKLTDDDVHIGNVKLAALNFVLHLAKEGFSLRLLTAMLDSDSFSRLDEAFQKAGGDAELLSRALEVLLTCFVPDQTPISLKLQERVQRLLQIHPEVHIRAICADIVLKFDLSKANILSLLVWDSHPVWQGVALEAIYKKADVLHEKIELVEALLSHVTRMGTANLVIMFKILKKVDLRLFGDRHLNTVRTVLVALMDRIRLEFDSLQDEDSGSEQQSSCESGDERHTKRLSDWCIPALEVLERHYFLMSAVSQTHLIVEKKKLDLSIGRMSLSEQALAEDRRKKRKSVLGGSATITSAGRLVEMLKELVSFFARFQETS